jgi:hypothetical protein
MPGDLRKTAELGEVVAAAFDNAAGYSTNPRKVSRLVTRAVALMRRNQRVRTTPSRWPLLIVRECSSPGS